MTDFTIYWGTGVCPCVKRHSPKPAYLQRHHIHPEGWGGKTVRDNLIDICGTIHDATHSAINKLVRARRFVSLTEYPILARKLAVEAVSRHVEATGAWPVKLTVSRPPA